jgi:dTDP-4-dehydrorhamnose 3,5-epimerase
MKSEPLFSEAMKKSTTLPDVKLLNLRLFKDDRGYFLETYSQRTFAKELGQNISFVQDNLSSSKKGALRGLHYQITNPQGKLVTVLSGEVYDVAVDLRKSSPTFGRWMGVYLKADPMQQLWIPPGFAHGFLVLSEQAIFSYKTTDFYTPAAERCIRWDDPDLAIEWPLKGEPLMSSKDLEGSSFKDADYFP